MSQAEINQARKADNAARRLLIKQARLGCQFAKMCLLAEALRYASAKGHPVNEIRTY